MNWWVPFVSQGVALGCYVSALRAGRMNNGRMDHFAGVGQMVGAVSFGLKGRDITGVRRTISVESRKWFVLRRSA